MSRTTIHSMPARSTSPSSPSQDYSNLEAELATLRADLQIAQASLRRPTVIRVDYCLNLAALAVSISMTSSFEWLPGMEPLLFAVIGLLLLSLTIFKDTTIPLGLPVGYKPAPKTLRELQIASGITPLARTTGNP